MSVSSLDILFLSKEDVDAVDLGLGEAMDAIELGLRAHGEKKVVMPSKDHLALDRSERHWNILKGYVEPIDVAGVKVIGDFEGNYRFGLPSELALITLYRTDTGAPFAILDGTLITWMRTGAVTAVGAKYLAPERPRVLGHVGARGTAWYNVPMLDRLFDFEEIRVTSKRPESRERFAARDVGAAREAGGGQGDGRGDGAGRRHHHRRLAPGHRRGPRQGRLGQAGRPDPALRRGAVRRVQPAAVGRQDGRRRLEPVPEVRVRPVRRDDPGRRPAGRAHLRRDRRDRGGA